MWLYVFKEFFVIGLLVYVVCFYNKYCSDVIYDLLNCWSIRKEGESVKFFVLIYVN